MNSSSCDLSKETFRINKCPTIEFRMYDTSLPGYIVIPVKPREGNEEILAGLGYERVSEKEIEENQGLRRYPKYDLYKISKEILQEIHK